MDKIKAVNILIRISDHCLETIWRNRFIERMVLMIRAANVSKIRDGWLQGQRLSIVSAVDFSALGEYEMVYPNLNTRRLVREGILFLLKFVFYFISPPPWIRSSRSGICKQACMPFT